MELKQACVNILEQISGIIDQIPNEEYTRTLESLSGSTLGQHFRHAIEFFTCLSAGYNDGEVCYDNRKHDKNLERDRSLAINVIENIIEFVEQTQLAKDLDLLVSYHPEDRQAMRIKSNTAREITYNIEHVVHHMALVKIGLRECCPQIIVPVDFGVAVSTLKYHKSLA